MSSHGSSLLDPFSGSLTLEAMANKTSSSAVSVHTGEHLFKVFRHSRIKGSNTCLTSKQFRVGGHDWAILYYPNGNPRIVDDQFTSVFLQLMSVPCDPEIMASYTFCLQQDPAAPLLTATGEKNKFGSTCKFSSKGDKEGRCKFISKSDLATSGCLKDDDSLVIKCYVEVVIEHHCDDSIIVPPSEMSRDLHNLFERGFRTDLTIMVGRFASFEAHGGILAARSPVFHAELCGPMMESKESVIQVEGISAKVFEVLLYYIYNDCLPRFMGEATTEATNMAQHLLVAADRYAIERLKLMCESKLSKALAISSVGYTLNLAEQYNCQHLKAHCLKYIGKNREKLRAVENAGGFVQLKHNYPLLAQDIFGKPTGKKNNKKKNKGENKWTK